MVESLFQTHHWLNFCWLIPYIIEFCWAILGTYWLPTPYFTIWSQPIYSARNFKHLRRVYDDYNHSRDRPGECQIDVDVTGVKIWWRMDQDRRQLSGALCGALCSILHNDIFAPCHIPTQICKGLRTKSYWPVHFDRSHVSEIRKSCQNEMYKTLPT